jgi:hypothetical protein
MLQEVGFSIAELITLGDGAYSPLTSEILVRSCSLLACPSTSSSIYGSTPTVLGVTL